MRAAALPFLRRPYELHTLEQSIRYWNMAADLQGNQRSAGVNIAHLNARSRRMVVPPDVDSLQVP